MTGEGEAVYRLRCPPLPDQAIPVSAVVVVHYLSADGKAQLALRVSDGLVSWEAIGMMTEGLDVLRSDALDQWDGRDG